MTRRQEERSDAIRAEVRRYIDKLDAGEIPNETKAAPIGFAVPKKLIGEPGNREIAELSIAEHRRQLSAKFNGSLSFNDRDAEAQPSQQPRQKGDKS